jgi:predicted alternative tryptophan synthase beta-subunit
MILVSNQRTLERRKKHEKHSSALQNLSNRRGDAKTMDEPAGRDERTARSLFTPWHPEASGNDDLTPVFCEELCRQELDETTLMMDIPEEVQAFLPHVPALTPGSGLPPGKSAGHTGKNLFKFEGNNTSGSHKLNAAAAMAYYAKEQGLTSLTTETGAGQWGTALATACAHFGLAWMSTW